MSGKMTEEQAMQISHMLMKMFFQSGGAIADVDPDDAIKMLDLDEDEILEYFDLICGFDIEDFADDETASEQKSSPVGHILCPRCKEGTVKPTENGRLACQVCHALF